MTTHRDDEGTDRPSGIMRQGFEYRGVLEWIDDAGPRRVVIARPVVVGSSEHADIRVQHTGISRLHADVSPEPDGVHIRDLGGSYKTTTNKGTTEIGHASINGESEFRFGQVRMEVAFERRAIQRFVLSSAAKWSDAWNDCHEQAWHLGQDNDPMIIRAANGGPADFFAMLVHTASPPRASRPFVVVECEMKHGNMGLAELIAQGAEANDPAEGLVSDPGLGIDQAGTLHVQHADWLSARAQRELLAWIRGGSGRPSLGIPNDTKVIVSSDEPLSTRLNRGFLEPLYFALSKRTMQIPRLAHRIADVPVMVGLVAGGLGIETVPEELLAQAREWARQYEDDGFYGLLFETLRKGGTPDTEY